MSDSNTSRRGRMVLSVVIRDPGQVRVLRKLKKVSGRSYTDFARKAMRHLAAEECYRLGIDYDGLVMGE